MLELIKIISAFLLPPGIIILILFTIGIFSWRKRAKGVSIALMVLGLFIWGLSVGPTAKALMSGLESGLKIPSNLQGDVIILLGGGIHQDVADLTGKGTPSSDMAGRILTAVRAHRMLKAPIIISGGAVYAGTAPEAPVVRRFLVDLGVPEKQVIIESKSRDTIENARYCREIIDLRGFRKPVLVTSAYHMKRSLGAFARVGISPLPLPAQFCTGSEKHIWASWLPNQGSLNTSVTAMREHLGLLFYRMK